MSLKTLVGQMWRVIYELLPSFAQKVIDQGLMKGLLILIALVVVGPIVITILAGIWLGALASLDFGPTIAMHKYLTSIIHRGLDTEGLAASSHERLDYMQLFGYDLIPHSVSRRELNLSLQPRQRVMIHIQSVEPVSTGPKCPLPADSGHIDLVTMALGDQPIRTLTRVSNEPIRIDKKWWDANEDKIHSSERLVFRLTDEARKLPCGYIRIEGSVRVYKNLEPQKQRK